MEVTRAYRIFYLEELCVLYPATAGRIKARRQNEQIYILHGRENFQKISPETQENPLNNNPTWKKNIKI